MAKRPTILGSMTAETFLTKYWQKKPLLIRQAIPNFESLVTPDDLAGIACQELANARLVQQLAGKDKWTVEHGPFAESRFESLPKSKWTLLVQEVEKWVPEIESLRQQFNFIPDWRTDDVMVSYAEDKGSVGPHIDQYDVFLLQGMGQRRWQIGSEPLATDEFIAGLDLKIMQKFLPDEEWILNPGDMLYLPPKIPHYGVALGPCMTYSVGFRAPSAGELLTSFIESNSDELEQLFYSDPDLNIQAHPGEIAKEAVEKAIALLRSLPIDPALAMHWFGRLVTQNRRHDPLQPPKRKLSSFGELLARKSSANGLHKSPEVRFAFSKMNRSSVELFIDGNEMILSSAMLPVIKKLCGNHVYTIAELKKIDPRSGAGDFLLNLFNQGYVVGKD